MNFKYSEKSFFQSFSMYFVAYQRYRRFTVYFIEVVFVSSAVVI